MKSLLIAYHSITGGSKAMAQAVAKVQWRKFSVLQPGGAWLKWPSR